MPIKKRENYSSLIGYYLIKTKIKKVKKNSIINKNFCIFYFKKKPLKASNWNGLKVFFVENFLS